jgi:hypothetical protein
MAQTPPAALDSARVLAYAMLDESVTYSGSRVVIVGGEPIGRVPRLAIAQNEDEVEVLLLYCDEQWQVLGAAYYPTMQTAIDVAELAYRGSTQKWQHVA